LTKLAEGGSTKNSLANGDVLLREGNKNNAIDHVQDTIGSIDIDSTETEGNGTVDGDKHSSINHVPVESLGSAGGSIDDDLVIGNARGIDSTHQNVEEEGLSDVDSGFSSLGAIEVGDGFIGGTEESHVRSIGAVIIEKGLQSELLNETLSGELSGSTQHGPEIPGDIRSVSNGQGDIGRDEKCVDDVDDTVPPEEIAGADKGGIHAELLGARVVRDGSVGALEHVQRGVEVAGKDSAHVNVVQKNLVDESAVLGFLQLTKSGVGSEGNIFGSKEGEIRIDVSKGGGEVKSVKERLENGELTIGSQILSNGAIVDGSGDSDDPIDHVQNSVGAHNVAFSLDNLRTTVDGVRDISIVFVNVDVEALGETRGRVNEELVINDVVREEGAVDGVENQGCINISAGGVVRESRIVGTKHSPVATDGAVEGRLQTSIGERSLETGQASSAHGFPQSASESRAGESDENERDEKS